MKIKICGLKNHADVDYANEAMPDYAGFVFAESRRRISPETAAEFRKRLNPGIAAAGVFANADISFIARLYSQRVIDIAQLHGAEDEDYIARLKEACGAPVIKALNAGNSFPANADYLLFDNGKGGSGKSFDWSALRDIGRHCAGKDWFLAGGINLGNIEEAMKLNPYCIDLSSGAENERGDKDREKMLKLAQMAKTYNCKNGEKNDT